MTNLAFQIDIQCILHGFLMEGHIYSIKGRGQTLVRLFMLLHITQVTKAHTSWRAHESNIGIGISINSKILELWTSKLRLWSVMCKVKVLLCTYMQNAPNSKCLGQLNGMFLLANTYKWYAPNNAKIQYHRRGFLSTCAYCKISKKLCTKISVQNWPHPCLWISKDCW